MPDKFSLNDLFKTGLDKDKFKAGFLESKNKAEMEEVFSIFGENIEGSVDNIFSEVDSDGDGKISGAEFDAVKARFSDTNQDEISTNDIKALYMSSVTKKYGTANPKQMYQAAMSGGAGTLSSDYVTQLDTQAETLNNLITERKTASEKKIQEYKDAIDEIVKKAAKDKGISSEKYAEQTQQTKDLQNKYDTKSRELEQKERELEQAQQKEKELQRELKSLEADPEKNKTEIEGIKYDIDNVTNTITSLTSSINDLKSEIKSTNEALKTSIKKQEQIQKNILANDKETQAKIKELKDKIEDEEKSAKADLEKYENERSKIDNARNFAIQEMRSSAAQSSEQQQLDFSNSAANCASLKDVNYSAEKGEKLAQYMRNHAVGFTGYCSRHVSNGIAGVGLGKERAPSAHMMDSLLAKNSNFKEITVSSKEELKSLPAGCIIVYEAGAAGYHKVHGHIEVTLGNGTNCSDGITRNPRYAEQGRMHVFVPVA